MFPAGAPEYRVRFEQLASGERVRVIESGPTAGTPLVFFGGWGCTVWDFNRTYPAMVAAGYRIIGVDLRGHGLSDMPSGEAPYTTEAMIAHGTEILDVLGITRPVIIGHSMGGALVAHLAMRHPGAVRGVVLVGAIGFGVARTPEVGRALSPKWAMPIARFLLRRAAVAAGLRILYVNDALVDERNVDEYWAPSQFHGFVPAMRALLHGFRWNRFTPGEILSIGVPCLLVRGARDPIVERPRDPVRLPAGSRELVIENAGHLPHDERPDLVNAALLEFLASV